MLIVVRPIGDKKLSCSTRGHVVVTDRKSEDGGSNSGCTSGELLLMAAGSCAMGSLRKALSEYCLAPDEINVEVEFTPAADPDARDGILITVSLADRAVAVGADAIASAATSGGVVSRLRLGSNIEVRSRPLRT
jgi:uncharacterized OsmC-like protein